MKIAFDYQVFVHQQYGGISRYFKCLAEKLLLQGESVNIFAPYHRNHYLKSVSPGLVRGKNIGKYPPKTSRAISYLNAVKSRHAIQRFLPDVVHETYYNMKGLAPKGCPTVITVYDMIHEIFPSLFSMRDGTMEKKRVAIERADHIICISENTRRDLLNILGVPEQKTSVIHLGFERFVSSKDITICSNDEKMFVLFVGSRGGYKNFLRLLEAFSASPRLKSDFNIVAFGGGKFSSGEREMIQRFGFGGGQVRQISGDDHLLAILYEKAKAFIFPSTYEGFGLPPLESMAHNCPVVSSNSSCMPEVIGGAAEYFDPNSTEEMVVALQNVLYSKQRVDELVSLGKKRLDMFSWEKCAAETLEVYERVIGSQ